MVNNKIPCVIVKVIVAYQYIHYVIGYDYSAPGIDDYDYLKSCNRLQSIMITDYDYPNPDTYSCLYS